MPVAHGAGCGCQHESELIGAPFLYPNIDREAIRCLNEQVPSSCKSVFKTYENRLEETCCISEEGDPEMIIHLSFLNPCRVCGLHLIGGESGTYPKTVKIFKDNEDLDFSSVHDVDAVQEVSLVEDFHGSVEYPLKVSKLQNVSSLCLYFNTSISGDATQLFYIGLRGESSDVQRKAVVTVYESRANPADHKVGEEEMQSKFV